MGVLFTTGIQIVMVVLFPNGGSIILVFKQCNRHRYKTYNVSINTHETTINRSFHFRVATTMTSSALQSDNETNNNDETVVRMIEIVSMSNCQNSGNGIFLMDIRDLLKLMDICSCAAAEKHTRVNCVTVSMSDTVLESYPLLGEVLELFAQVVLTGRTSLDIMVTVTAQGEDGVQRMICKASFVYVTTRGPNGEKRFCPPLNTVLSSSDHDNFQWESKIAQYRKNLVMLEQRSRRSFCNDDGDAENDNDDTKFDLLCSEVVLPAAQNHMDNTFGGQIMAWMAKVALSVASRKARVLPSKLLVRAILKVDFQTGSNVSDHLHFKTRLNAVFDEGRSAEVEVRVSKKSLSTGEETKMNVGYFYISGSAMGTGTDIPFQDITTHPVPSNALYLQAISRRRHALARRYLLAGEGHPVEWHPSLHKEACLLTVESVLRLVQHHGGEQGWHSIFHGSDVVQSLEWARGESWGRNDTFVLRTKAAMACGSLADLLRLISTNRRQWDAHCLDIQVLEDGMHASPLPYDVILHTALTPKSMLELGDNVDCEVHYCRLRTGEINHDAKTAILASQSVVHPSIADRRMATVRPSGWFLDLSEDGETIQVTYIAEHDLKPLRKVTKLPDERIVETLSRLSVEWLTNIQSILRKDKVT
jgi:acyl-CoA hydrolase